MTANLQKAITVKQAAQTMGVSERSVYMAKKVASLRPDLDAEILAGNMSVNKACRLATGKPEKARRFCRHCGG